VSDTSNSYLIGASATLIALASLVTSIWSAVSQRQHDRLSVRPRITVGYNEPKDVGGSFWLTNHGFGPAQIKWFQISVDGKVHPDWDEVMLQLGVPVHKAERFAVPTGGIYNSGSTTHIFVMRDEAALNILRTQNRRVKFTWCYCSLYEQCWIVRNSTETEVDECQEQKVPSLRVAPRFYQASQ